MVAVRRSMARRSHAATWADQATLKAQTAHRLARISGVQVACVRIPSGYGQNPAGLGNGNWLEFIVFAGGAFPHRGNAAIEPSWDWPWVARGADAWQ